MSLRGDAPLSYETLTARVEDGLLTLTLNRPDRLNAVNAVMIDEYVAALDAADRDDGVRAVIVTGAGRAFCAGADLSGGPGTFDRAPPEPGARHRDGGGLVALRLFDMKKPVIAAVNGPAVGFGATQTLPMDIRLASTGSPFRLRLLPARRGDGGGVLLVPAAPGGHAARDGVGCDRPRLLRGGGARRRAGALAACARRAAAGSARARARRSRTTPRPCRSRSAGR